MRYQKMITTNAVVRVDDDEADWHLPGHEHRSVRAQFMKYLIIILWTMAVKTWNLRAGIEIENLAEFSVPYYITI